MAYQYRKPKNAEELQDILTKTNSEVFWAIAWKNHTTEQNQQWFNFYAPVVLVFDYQTQNLVGGAHIDKKTKKVVVFDKKNRNITSKITKTNLSDIASEIKQMELF